ncbi:peptidoglycan DD-metalloendopeptidase family protein [Nonomuraea sp. NPDC050153]|uniref:M23 family metallopeptidase n=1 Tax=Nonomuraea sp. NPDC050153 TaxID=3364359 RepID=UPI003791CFF4
MSPHPSARPRPPRTCPSPLTCTRPTTLASSSQLFIPAQATVQPVIHSPPAPDPPHPQNPVRLLTATARSAKLAPMNSRPLTPATRPPAPTVTVTPSTPEGCPTPSTEPDTRRSFDISTLGNLEQAPHPHRTPHSHETGQSAPPPLAHHSPRSVQRTTSSPARHLLDPPRAVAPPRTRRPLTPPQETGPPRTRQAFTTARSALITLLFTAAILLLPASPARASPPTWRWPLNGHPRILRHFTPPPEPWLAGHRGIDLAAPASTPVLAAGPGTVRFAGPVAGKGVVTIEHEGGFRTTYLPVEASVRRGQPVTPGSLLGLIEASPGHCQESCLHWGLRRGTHYLNPLLLLGQAPIRLLPFWLEDGTPLTPADEHSSRNANKRPFRPPGTGITKPLITQPRRRRSPTTPIPAPPPAGPKALTIAPVTPTSITHAVHSLTPDATHDTSSPTRDDGAPSQRHPMAAAESITPATSRRKLHPTPPTATFDFLPRSASTTTTSAIGLGLGALLGMGLLITALRSSHRRARTTPRRLRRRGQHRATTEDEQPPENTNTRHRGAKDPPTNGTTTTNAKPGRHRKTATDRN